MEQREDLQLVGVALPLHRDCLQFHAGERIWGQGPTPMYRQGLGRGPLQVPWALQPEAASAEWGLSKFPGVRVLRDSGWLGLWN